MPNEKNISALMVSMIFALFLAAGLVIAPVVVSISQVDMHTEGYQDLTGSVIYILISAIPTANDGIIAILNAGSMISDNSIIEYDLKMELDSTENFCTYQMAVSDPSEHPEIFTVDTLIGFWYVWEVPPQDQIVQFVIDWGDANGCVEGGRGAYVTTDIYGNLHYYCPKIIRQLGQTGPISSGTKDFATKVTVTPSKSGSYPESATLTNTGMQDGVSAKIGNHVWIWWLGSTVSGVPCQEPAHELAMFTQDKWEVINKQTFVNFRTYTIPQYQQCLIDAYNGYVDLDTCEGQFNDAADSAATPKTTGFFMQQATSVITGDIIRFTMSNLLIYPQFRIITDAEWAGVISSVGVPSIISASSQQFNEGDFGGYIDAVVKNVGSGTGSFSFSIKECTGPGFTPADTAHLFNLNAGQEKSDRLKVKQFSNDAIDIAYGVCTIEFKEMTTQESATANVAVSAVQRTSCVPGEKACEGTTIIQCDALGQNMNIIMDCADEGKVCEYRGIPLTPTCVSKNGNGCIEEGYPIIPAIGGTCCEGLKPAGGFLGVGMTCEKPGVSWLELIVSFIASFILVFIIAVVGLVILGVALMFIYRPAGYALFSNIKLFIGIALLFSIILAIMFTATVGAFIATLI